MSVKIVKNPYANEFKCHQSLEWMVVISYRKVRFFKSKEAATRFARKTSVYIQNMKEQNATI